MANLKAIYISTDSENNIILAPFALLETPDGWVMPVGPRGFDGAPGPQGIQGIQGEPGPAGRDGRDRIVTVWAPPPTKGSAVIVAKPDPRKIVCDGQPAQRLLRQDLIR